MRRHHVTDPRERAFIPVEQQQGDIETTREMLERRADGVRRGIRGRQFLVDRRRQIVAPRRIERLLAHDVDHGRAQHREQQHDADEGEVDLQVEALTAAQAHEPSILLGGKQVTGAAQGENATRVMRIVLDRGANA